MKRLPYSIILITGTILLLLQACADSPTAEPSPQSTQTPSGENEETTPMPIQEFVRQTFIGGVPYEEVLNNYDTRDIAALLPMLNNRDEIGSWANIVTVLNIIGDESVFEPLITFINAPVDGTLPRPHFAAKTSALLSMGYLINHTKSEAALTYLIDSLDPAVWQERGTTGISPFLTSQEDTDLELSKQALLGLSLSGTDQAAEALRSLQTSETTGQQAIFQANVKDLIPEALATNEEIANIGLINYYSNP